MKLNNALKTALLALSFSATPALAQQALDEGGFTPSFTDDDLFTYARGEVDYTSKDDGVLRWDAEGWIGGDYQKLWLVTEGDVEDGDVEEASLQLLYGRYLAPFWDWRVGLRHDFEPGSLSYAVLGLKGLAPYRFEIDASLFLSEDGDLSAELEAEYALLLTQKLIAEPYVNLALYAQDVKERGKGAGLSEIGLGVQLRYEIRREFAPYVDVGYTRLLGDTANFAEAAGENKDEFVVRAGLRFWY